MILLILHALACLPTKPEYVLLLQTILKLQLDGIDLLSLRFQNPTLKMIEFLIAVIDIVGLIIAKYVVDKYTS